MPRSPRGGGDSLATAIAQFLGGSGVFSREDRNVTYSYLGRDAQGRGVYAVAYTLGGVTRRVNLAVAYENGEYKIGTPSAVPSSRDAEAVAQEPDEDLAAAQRAALSRLSELVKIGSIDSADVPQLMNTIRNWSGTAGSLYRWVGKMGAGFIPPRVNVDDPRDAGFSFDLGLPSIGGGGGGGFAGPQYVAPDRRVVEDFVKGMLVSLVGRNPQPLVDRFTDLYMKDHRRNFDTPAQEIDPRASVLEAIRGTQDYQTIHKLRPESVDERDWISQRAVEAQRGGLETGAIEDFAITQATVGADVGDVAEAAASAQFQRSGQAPDLLKGQIQNAIQSVFSGVVR